MATTGSLMRHSGLRDELNEIPPYASAKQMRQALTGRKYKLDFYKGASGESEYGIVPIHDLMQDGHQYAHGYTVAGVAQNHTSHRLRLMDFVLLFGVLGAFGVVLAYYIDGNHDGFNDWMSSNTFGPRFVLTGSATVIATLWKSVEQSAVVMAPYTRLANHPATAKSTILFTPHNTPVLASIATIKNGYLFVASVTGMTLAGEVLNILISGVPYSTGQTWRQFLASIYASMAILGMMIIVSVGTGSGLDRSREIPEMANSVEDRKAEARGWGEKFEAAHAALMERNWMKYFRFDVTGLEDVPLEEWSHEDLIKEKTSAYLAQPEVGKRFYACVDAIAALLLGPQGR